MTKEESLQKVATGWWIGKSAEDIVRFQLYEDRLCMPFGDFHEAVEKVLGRSVFTHAFAMPELLRKEFESVLARQRAEVRKQYSLHRGEL